jgi:hypothetical protein
MTTTKTTITITAANENEINKEGININTVVYAGQLILQGQVTPECLSLQMERVEEETTLVVPSA